MWAFFNHKSKILKFLKTHFNLLNFKHLGEISGKKSHYKIFKSQNIKNFFRPNIDQQTPQKNKFFSNIAMDSKNRFLSAILRPPKTILKLLKWVKKLAYINKKWLK